ncbi:hypothetical protein PXK01_13880 [Phaeobacter sp. PT47_59]|uniref:hypothetical protein n=1 Tax=Phaeobacter sp. PT47_59 TaxID=3029979 RepID=UPI0023804F0D|nr:hypothetical protein [Phaeobacter sp. PT47_59]MDE4175248.1 hypothetical protein [Phaeobacter sp. PT47_59]
MAKKKKSVTSSPSRTALVVLGAHCSGTSALAGVLTRMGADLPQEPMHAAALNDALLASAGSSWDDWHEIDEDWYNSPLEQEYALQAQKMLTQDFGTSRLFVLRDSRICRLLPFWNAVMAQSGIEPHFVWTHRNPVKVAAALTRRNGWPESHGLLLWLRHVLDAEAGSRGCKRSFVSCDGLLANWPKAVERIGSDLELFWPIRPGTAAPGIEEFLSETRRNFHAADMEELSQGIVSGWVGETHGILERWVCEGETQSDYKRLDIIRATLREMDALLSLLMQETQRESDRVQRLTSEVEQSQVKIAELDAAARTAQQEAASHAFNHATEQKIRANAQAQVNELNEALETVREEANSLRADNAAERQARAAAEAQYRALEDSHYALEDRHDALKKTLEQTDFERDQLRSQLEQSRAEAEEVHSQTIADERKISELECHLQNLEAEHRALRRKSERDARQVVAMKQMLFARLDGEMERLLSGETSDGQDQEPQSPVSEGAAKRDRIALAEETAQKRTAELDVAVNMAREEAQTLQASTVSERQAREAAEARIVELDAACNAAREEVERLLNSKSWRVTAPLRYIVTKMRGGG